MGNGLFWLSLEPEGITAVPVVLTSLIQNSNCSFCLGLGVKYLFVTVRCSGSDSLLEGFRKVRLWQKNNKEGVKWSKMVVFCNE